MWVRFPPGTFLCDFATLRFLGKVRRLALRLIRFLPKAHPSGLRLCRSTPVGSIPAGDSLLQARVATSSVECQMFRRDPNFPLIRVSRSLKAGVLEIALKQISN